MGEWILAPSGHDAVPDFEPVPRTKPERVANPHWRASCLASLGVWGGLPFRSLPEVGSDTVIKCQNAKDRPSGKKTGGHKSYF